MNIDAQVGGEIKLYLLCYRTLKLFMKKEVRENLFKKPKTVETF
ncbi:hypothetical protein [Clostridium sp.]|nr:hypothetical protein [Clostridium sp.]